MLIGYYRTSTIEQQAGFEAQERDLKAAGCEKLFGEQLSGKDRDRPQLEAALEFIREGDTLVATKVDRMARSTKDLLDIVAAVHKKGATVRILSPDLTIKPEGTDPFAKLTFDILGALAELERSMMLQRQREGIAKGKAEGRYKGRAPTARSKADELLALVESGVGPSDAAAKIGISRASAFRILKAARGGKAA